jgi:hypothetical protein
MAKKRALVDMVLTVTAASDIFTQDLEDMDIKSVIEENAKEEKKPQPKPQAKPDIPLESGSKPKDEPRAEGDTATQSDKDLFVNTYNHAGWKTAEAFKVMQVEFGRGSVIGMPREEFNSFMEIMKAGPVKWKEVQSVAS